MKQAPEWEAVAASGSFGASKLVASAKIHKEKPFLWMPHRRKYAEEFERLRAVPSRFFQGLPENQQKFPENVFCLTKEMYEEEYGKLVIPKHFLCDYPVQETRTGITALLEIHPDALNVCNILGGSKGVEEESAKRVCQVIEEVMGYREQLQRVCFMMGGDLAEDLFAGALTGAAIAGGKDAVLSFSELYKGSNLLLAPYGPEYRTVLELSAALKNIYALAAGIATGMGHRPNTIHALSEACFAESRRLLKKVKKDLNEVLLNGPLSDHTLSVVSGNTRNFKAGKKLGETWKNERRVLSRMELTDNNKIVIEGICSARPMLKIAKEYDMKLLIVGTMADLLDHKIDPDEAERNLITLLQEWYARLIKYL